MQLELILSKPELDARHESIDYKPNKSIERSHISGRAFAFIEFRNTVPGRNLPLVRAAFDLDDAIKIIGVLASAGNARAAVVENACKLALSVIDYS